MAAPGMIEIPIEEYLELQTRSDWLHCLETAGVDNWEGYDEARRILRDEEARLEE
jgi:hypothetical protein